MRDITVPATRYRVQVLSEGWGKSGSSQATGVTEGEIRGYPKNVDSTGFILSYLDSISSASETKYIIKLPQTTRSVPLTPLARNAPLHSRGFHESDDFSMTVKFHVAL